MCKHFKIMVLHSNLLKQSYFWSASHIPFLSNTKYWYKLDLQNFLTAKNHWSVFNVYKPTSSPTIQVVSHWYHFLKLKDAIRTHRIQTCQTELIELQLVTLQTCQTNEFVKLRSCRTNELVKPNLTLTLGPLTPEFS